MSTPYSRRTYYAFASINLCARPLRCVLVDELIAVIATYTFCAKCNLRRLDMRQLQASLTDWAGVDEYESL